MNIWIRALRVNQWTKNVVVFAAWFFAVADASQAAVARGVRPFLLVCAMALSFSLVASSTCSTTWRTTRRTACTR